MSIGGGAFDEPAVTIVTRRAQPRGGSATCLDTGNGLGSFADVGDGARRVPIRLAAPGRGTLSISSRCGGPMLADIARALPTLRPTAAELRAGPRLDSSGWRRFAAGGLAGTVDSALGVQTQRLRREAGASGLPPGVP